VGKRPFDRLITAVGSPYGSLLLALAFMLVVYPYLGSHKELTWVFNLIVFGIVVAALRVTHGTGMAYRVGWLLGLSTLVSAVLSDLSELAFAYPLAAGFRALYFGFLIVVILSDIFRRRHITPDAVMGASSALILLGLAFSSIYIMLEWHVPGSFLIPDLPASIEQVYGPTSTQFSLVYFSFVTMTTIGFGDIVPLAPPARSLAALEGLLTQLYLATIIARLVGLEIANRIQDERPRRK